MADRFVTCMVYLTLPRGSRIPWTIWDMFPALDLYYIDAAQHLIPAGYDLDDLERHVRVRRALAFPRMIVVLYRYSFLAAVVKTIDCRLHET